MHAVVKYIFSGLRCLPVNVHIKSPTKRSPTSLAYRPMGLNSTSEIMGITASPISLEGLSFFEFDKLIGDHGEFQKHSIQIIATRYYYYHVSCDICGWHREITVPKSCVDLV
jgi:hypothetical protein